MLPDLSIEQRNSWLVLGGATVVVLGVLWYVWDGSGPLGDQVEAAHIAREKISGSSKQDMHQRVEQQRQANDELRRTIEKLKGESGFEVFAKFAILPSGDQPGYQFKRRFIEVRQALREKAAPRSILYDENIGFGSDDKVPDDIQAPYLMAMLQLTEKAITIAINTPSPLYSMSITHGPAVETGPENRPVLLREYPLELKVHGTLKDILWILHRISEVEVPGAEAAGARAVPGARTVPAGTAGAAAAGPGGGQAGRRPRQGARLSAHPARADHPERERQAQRYHLPARCHLPHRRHAVPQPRGTRPPRQRQRRARGEPPSSRSAHLLRPALHEPSMNLQRLAATIAAVVLLLCLGWWQTSDPQVDNPGKPTYNGPVMRGLQVDVPQLPPFPAFYVNAENPFLPYARRLIDKGLENPPDRPPTQPRRPGSSRRPRTRSRRARRWWSSIPRSSRSSGPS